MAHHVGQRFLENTEQADRLGIAQRWQILRHLHQAWDLRTRLEASGLPFDGRGDTGIEDRRPQRRRHISYQLEQLGDQALHAVESFLQAGVQLRIGQFAHGRFQLQHRQHLTQFVVDFPGDTGLFLFPHTFQVRRQFAQLFPGAGQLQLDTLAFGDVPDNTVPDVGAILETTGDRLDLSPALPAFAGQDAPLPRPVTVAVQRLVLGAVIIGLVLRMHQAAQAGVAASQGRGGITHQALAAFADVGKIDLTGHRCPLQAEDQARHVGSDALQARFAFAQRRQRTTALGHVVEVDHQVLGITETQEAQGNIGRQNAAISPHALGLEALWSVLAGPGALPQVQPAIHVQARLEVDQGALDDRTGFIAQHGFGGAVGVAHMAVPVDPENADRALIDGKLGEPKRFLAGGTLGDIFARGAQASLQPTLLTTLPEYDGDTAQEQGQHQQRQVLPEPRGLGQARILGFEPATVQLLQLLGGDRLQPLVDYFGQLRPVPTRSDPQQLRQADVADHHQLGELRLDHEPAQLRLVDHRVASLLAEQQLQGLALHRHTLQIQRRIGAVQVIRRGAGHAYRDPDLGIELFQFHTLGALLLTDNQLRHAHVRIGEQPEPEPTRRLGQARGDIHFTIAQRGLQLRQILEIAPGQLDIQYLAQPLHQLDVGAGQALQASIILRIRRLQDQANPQLRMLCQPLALSGTPLHAMGRRRGRSPRHQGKP
ncbi:hypothetical protein SRABI112_02200 [Pseudomonas mediterranea]|nr:hypothetical protein SRABI112_02200 [Pseudomonas mediterranea]